MSSEGVKDDCLAWAAGDPSGVLSPYKFSRRYALGFPLKVDFRFLHAMFIPAVAIYSLRFRIRVFRLIHGGFVMYKLEELVTKCLLSSIDSVLFVENNNQSHELFDVVTKNELVVRLHFFLLLFFFCNRWLKVIWEILSRALGKDDVSLKITHCGVCYADVIWSKNKHGDSRYPLVPGYVA
jgi:hypothetical protein